MVAAAHHQQLGLLCIQPTTCFQPITQESQSSLCREEETKKGKGQAAQNNSLGRIVSFYICDLHTVSCSEKSTDQGLED
jgi:hypothetical protein